MQHNHDNNVMVALLDEIVNHTLPRIQGIKSKLVNGDSLLDSELSFFHETLGMINSCDRDYPQDPDCEEIFKRLAHMLGEVIELAHQNARNGFPGNLKVELS